MLDLPQSHGWRKGSNELSIQLFLLSPASPTGERKSIAISIRIIN
jgi:hypothetical protein